MDLVQSFQNSKFPGFDSYSFMRDYNYFYEIEICEYVVSRSHQASNLLKWLRKIFYPYDKEVNKMVCDINNW